MRQPGRGGRCRPPSLGAWPGGSAGGHRVSSRSGWSSRNARSRDGVRPGPPGACSWHPATRSARSSPCPSSLTASRAQWCRCGVYSSHAHCTVWSACPQSACVTAVRRGNRVWKLRRMAVPERDVLCRAGPGHRPVACFPSLQAKKSRASGQDSLSVAPGGTPIQPSSRSRTSRVATLLDPG